MPNLHPLIVHLPIALLTFSFFFDLFGILRKRPEYERTAWWSLLAGTTGLILSVVSGLWAENVTEIPVNAREHFETHQQLAFLTTALYATLLLWRIAAKTRVPHSRETRYTVLSFFGVALVWFTAWYGGELVYNFGVGVMIR